MKNNISPTKKEFFLCIFLNALFYLVFCPLFCFCYEPTKTIIITKEDIKNAKPISPFDVNFSPKELKNIKMMEKRHFNKTYEDLKDEERLMQLEYELLGKTWKYTQKEKRIKTLLIASTNIMLQGTSLPPSIGSERNAKRMANDSIDYRKKEDVGLIDGFLRLLSPEKYEVYRAHSKRRYEDWADSLTSSP